jgi:hypothetical protein
MLCLYVWWCEKGERLAGSIAPSAYMFLRPCFHEQAVVPLAGVCSHDLGNKIGMGGECVEHVDDLPAFTLLLAGDAEKHVALFQRTHSRVDGFPVGTAAGVVQKAAVAVDRGKFTDSSDA